MFVLETRDLATYTVSSDGYNDFRLLPKRVGIWVGGSLSNVHDLGGLVLNNSNGFLDV